MGAAVAMGAASFFLPVVGTLAVGATTAATASRLNKEAEKNKNKYNSCMEREAKKRAEENAEIARKNREKREETERQKRREEEENKRKLEEKRKKDKETKGTDLDELDL